MKPLFPLTVLSLRKQVRKISTNGTAKHKHMLTKKQKDYEDMNICVLPDVAMPTSCKSTTFR